MVDLNFTIEGKTAGELARYFNCSVELILGAIMEAGANTYQEVHDYIMKASKKNEN